MTSKKSKAPVAVGAVKIEGTFYQPGAEIPVDRVSSERLARLIQKGRVAYPDAAQSAPANRADDTAGRPDLKVSGVDEGKADAAK